MPAERGGSLFTEVAVALDFSDPTQAVRVVRELSGLPVLYKVGLELYTQTGPDFVKALVANGNRVFLDLKFHDIPNTVAKAAKQVAELNVELFTLHLAGGKAMLEKVREELATVTGKAPKAVGVTVLTSFSQTQWEETLECVSERVLTISDSARKLTRMGIQAGIDGVVCSAHELKLLKELNPKLYTVVPGIRPAGSASQDQARTVTPKEASDLGADLIVVGRPITQAVDPRAVTEKILQELAE